MEQVIDRALWVLFVVAVYLTAAACIAMAMLCQYVWSDPKEPFNAQAALKEKGGSL